MVLNVNIGVLGHVDSGKTSLSKALSTQASTASFDKNPQSQERGITLDLGFSAFTVAFVDGGAPVSCESAAATAGGPAAHELPTALSERWGRPASLQFTLVDCPGHASLIRTVIGGSQIIDAVMLVVDATKGIQTQTAECLVLAEIVCSSLILVLNKVDLFPEAERARSIDRLTRRLHKTLEATKFAGCPVVAVAACPQADGGAASAPIGLDRLVELLVANVPVPTRSPAGPLLFAVDHCFGIRGQGTVLTGTLLSGCLRVGDAVEVAHEQRRVKGLQIFRKPVDSAQQGDRLGMCVTQLDPKLLERGLVCSPGSVPTVHALVMPVSPVAHYKLPVRSKAKLHVSLGHDTAMATLLLFRCPEPGQPLEQQYCEYVEEADMRACPAGLHALLEFERPIQAPPNAVVIVSKLDVDINQNVCRVAMHGRPLAVFPGTDYRREQLPKLLRVYRPKCRRGRLDRVKDPYTVIATGLFRKETALDAFLGLQVTLSNGQAGRIEGSFGQSGKCTVRMLQPLPDEFCKKYSGGKRSKGGGGGGGPLEPVEICLNFKRLLFDPLKKMTQT